MKRFCFPKSKRLLRNSQFKMVLDSGHRASDGLITLYLAENTCGYSRLGVSVGKSCGGAVIRNRLKRLLREAFRVSQHEIPAGFDYLLMICPGWAKKTCKESEPKTAIKKLTFEQIRDSILALISKAAKMKG